MQPEELMCTKKVAAVRIHVGWKMERIKSFKILAGEIEGSMFDDFQVLVHVCAMLINFQGITNSIISFEPFTLQPRSHHSANCTENTPSPHLEDTVQVTLL